ncbi:MAG: hypothetical protein V1913_08795 [Fibrobacterota bacterium]
MMDAQQIESGLSSAHWTERRAAVDAFLALSEGEVALAVLRSLASQGNEAALLHLLRESGRLSVSASSFLLRFLLLLENPPFLRETAYAVEKLPLRERIDLCLDVLGRRPSSDAAARLVRILGNTRAPRVVFPLLDLLAAGEPATALECLAAFRKLRDVRTVAPLLEALELKAFSGEPLFELVVTLGELSRLFFVRLSVFVPLLEAPDARVRQAAVWSIAHYPRHRVPKLLLRHFAKEENPAVRLELLKQLKRFPRRECAEFLFTLLSRNRDGRENLMADSALAEMLPRLSARFFRRFLTHPAAGCRNAACRHALLRLTPHEAVTALIRLLANDPDKNVRLTAAEALAYARGNAAERALATAALNDPAVADAALLSLCRGPFSDQQDLFAQILSDASPERAFRREAVLAFLPRHFETHLPREPLLSRLREALADQSPDLRYLAVVALQSTRAPSALTTTIDHLPLERTVEVRGALLDAALALSNNDPAPLLALLSARHERLLPVMEAIAAMHLDSGRKAGVMSGLLTTAVEIHSLDAFMESVSRMDNRSPDAELYLRLLAETPVPDAGKTSLLAYLATQAAAPLSSEAGQDLGRVYASGTPEVRAAAVPLFALAPHHLPLAMDLHHRETDPALKESLRHAILVHTGAKHG